MFVKLYVITENIQVNEGRKYFLEGLMLPSGRMLASPVLYYGQIKYVTK